MKTLQTKATPLQMVLFEIAFLSNAKGPLFLTHYSRIHDAYSQNFLNMELVIGTPETPRT